MNGDDPELDELLAPLRDGPVSLSGAERERARRARLMPGVQRAVRVVPRMIARRRMMRRIRYGSSALLAVASCAWLVSSFAFRAERAGHEVAGHAAPHVQVESRGAEPLQWLAEGADERAIAGSDELSTAGELRAREGARAALTTTVGARVELLPRSRIRMLQQRGDRDVETLSLLAGEVHCQVPKLQEGQSFVIDTPEARVIVHGTDFRVRVDDARGSCVSVREGLVEVQSGGASSWLGPNASWGCDDEQTRVQHVSPAAERRPAVRRRVDGVRAHGARGGRARAAGEKPLRATGAAVLPSGKDEAARTGTLSAETELLAAALRAEQDGRPERARALFVRLIAEHPDSALLPEAKAGLARLR